MTELKNEIDFGKIRDGINKFKGASPRSYSQMTSDDWAYLNQCVEDLEALLAPAEMHTQMMTRAMEITEEEVLAMAEEVAQETPDEKPVKKNSKKTKA